MKLIKYLLLLAFTTTVSAQTPFPTGIRFPNITQTTTADSIPVMGRDGIIKSFIPADSLKGGGSITVPNLQEVTDVGYFTTNPISTSSYLQGGLEIIVPNDSKYFNLLRLSNGSDFIKYYSDYWYSSSSWQNDGSLYVGIGSGKNNSTSSLTINSSGFGHNSLMSNKGSQSSGFGHSSLGSNQGQRSNGFGYGSLSSNRGDSSNGFGNLSLYTNIGINSNGFGHNSLNKNRGDNANGFGYYALFQNLGSNSSGFGDATLKFNDRNNNTALGYNSFSDFYDDVALKRDVLPEDVDLSNRHISIPNHGFTPSGSRFINLRYTTTGTPITGLSNNEVYQFDVIDANTIVISNGINSQGTGIHTFTPQYQYTNSTTLGANSQPTASNQITLGDSNVTEVTTYGAINAKAYGAGSKTGTPTYNIATDAAGNFIETPLGGGSSGTVYKLITTDTYTLLPEDSGKFLIFDHPDGTDLTIEDGLPAGFEVEIGKSKWDGVIIVNTTGSVDVGGGGFIGFYNARIVKLTEGNRVYLIGFDSGG